MTSFAKEFPSPLAEGDQEGGFNPTERSDAEFLAPGREQAFGFLISVAAFRMERHPLPDSPPPERGILWLVKSKSERPVAIPPAFQADPVAVGTTTGNPFSEK